MKSGRKARRIGLSECGHLTGKPFAGSSSQVDIPVTSPSPFPLHCDLPTEKNKYSRSERCRYAEPAHVATHRRTRCALKRFADRSQPTLLGIILNTSIRVCVARLLEHDALTNAQHEPGPIPRNEHQPQRVEGWKMNGGAERGERWGSARRVHTMITHADFGLGHAEEQRRRGDERTRQTVTQPKR